MFAPLPYFLFTAGSLIPARLAHIDHVRPTAIASSSFAFITLYRADCRHWNRGFRDIYSKLLAKHDLQQVVRLLGT